MHTTFTTARAIRKLVAALAVALGAIAVCSMFAGQAKADQFSPYLISYHLVNPFLGCQVKYGWVQDPYGNISNYRTVGGAQVTSCTARHTLSLYEQEQVNYSPDSGRGLGRR